MTSEPAKPYLRIRTEDDHVVVIEVRQDGETQKMYGPFKTADEQREFMRKMWAIAPCDDKLRANAIAHVDAWRRFDEP